MTPEELERFVADGRVSYTMTHPAVGHRSGTKPALRLFASDNKIAVYTGDDERDPEVSVYTTARKIGDDTVAIQTLRPFPAPTLLLTKIRPENPKYEDFDDAFERLDDEIKGNWEGLREKANQRMRETEVWEEPPRNTVVHYMTWFEYSEDKNFSGPKGIVAIPPGGRSVVGIPFPGREDEAAEFVHWKGLPENPDRALRALALEAGSRNLFFSEPREMNGHSWDDAAQRALFDYGAEIYAKTNRSPF